MKKDIVEFVSRCLVCQQVKTEHQKPIRTLKPLPITKWKWEHITMDFVINLPCAQTSHDAILVIADRLTKSAHFLAIRSTFSLDRMVRLCIDEIVKLYEVLVTIVSNRDPRFTSQFWLRLQKALGTT